jgi:hypothetical protein
VRSGPALRLGQRRRGRGMSKRQMCRAFSCCIVSVQDGIYQTAIATGQRLTTCGRRLSHV